MSIWVIAIAYDYGVVREAGYFTNEKSARAWIEAEHNRRRKQWNEIILDLVEELREDYDDCRSEFYPVKLKRSKDYL
jgi:hypothetical protein